MWCAEGERFTARGWLAALVAVGWLTSSVRPVREATFHDTVLVPYMRVKHTEGRCE